MNTISFMTANYVARQIGYNMTEGWMQGKPDVVLEMSKEYRLSAEGADVYRNFVLPNNNSEDRYVAAMEVRPGNTKIVHHVIAYLDGTGRARQLDASRPRRTGTPAVVLLHAGHALASVRDPAAGRDD